MNSNDVLEKYLTRYCTASAAPQYAVMLNGPWGSGKTWFIDAFCKKLKAHSNISSLYVSLYGVKSPADISIQFYQQLHPKLSSPAIQKTWSLVKSVVKATVKIDVDAASSELELSLPELERRASPQGAVLIFDDFERALMEPVELLGYINQFVEHDGYRVIIVANEKVMQKEGDTSAFASMKEKVVGRTFSIQAQAEGALITFLDELVNSDAIQILAKNKSTILDVQSISGYGNLRYLRQALHDFADLWEWLPVQSHDLKSHPDFLKRLVKDVIAISIESRSGVMPISSLSEGATMNSASRNIARQSDESVPVDKAYERLVIHGLHNSKELAVPPELYRVFFEKGAVPQDVAERCIENSRYFVDQTKPAWLRLWYRNTLCDEEFVTVITSVRQQLRDADFDTLEVLLHVVSLLMSAAGDGYIDDTTEEILTQGKAAANTLLQREAVLPGAPDYYQKLDLDSSHGLGYSGRQSPEFTKFGDYLRDIQIKAREQAFSKWAEAWMTELASSPEKAAARLHRSGIDATYSHQPILRYVKTEAFIELLMQFQTPALAQVKNALHQRYHPATPQEEWKLDEMAFVVACGQLLAERMGSTTHSAFSKRFLKHELLPEFESAAKQLDGLLDLLRPNKNGY